MNLPNKAFRYLNRQLHKLTRQHSSWEAYGDEAYRKSEFMAGEHFAPSQAYAVQHIADLAAQGPLRLLDAGCGNGRFYRDLRDIPNIDYTGVDFTENLVKTARELYPEGNFQQMDVRELRFDDQAFDFVIAQHVIRHIKDFTEPLAEMMRVAKHDVMIIEKDIRFGDEVKSEYYNPRAGAYFYVRAYDYDKMAAFAAEHGFTASCLNDARENPELQYILLFQRQA